MGKRSHHEREDRARLRALVDAVTGELRRGREPEAVAEDLLALGFDRATARRVVARIARGPATRPSVPLTITLSERGKRLATDALLFAAGSGVALACVSAGEHGIPMWIAAAAIFASCADGFAALVARPASA